MTRLNSSLMIVALTVLAVRLAAAAEPVPPALAPGSPALYLAHDQLADALKTATAKPADPAFSRIAVTDEYSINEVHRAKDGAAAIHPTWTELHVILDGSANFVTGGKIIPPVGGGLATIEGGVSRRVAKGDAILIPPNTPHAYNHIDGLTYLEVRFISPAAVAAAK
jgi:mannose-6-phosphate isomerase-like protein (cupin superfamily)